MPRIASITEKLFIVGTCDIQVLVVCFAGLIPPYLQTSVESDIQQMPLGLVCWIENNFFNSCNFILESMWSGRGTSLWDCSLLHTTVPGAGGDQGMEKRFRKELWLQSTAVPSSQSLTWQSSGTWSPILFIPCLDPQRSLAKVNCGISHSLNFLIAKMAMRILRPKYFLGRGFQNSLHLSFDHPQEREFESNNFRYMI